MERRYKLPCDQQRWLVGHHFPADNATLKDLGITDDSFMGTLYGDPNWCMTGHVPSVYSRVALQRTPSEVGKMYFVTIVHRIRTENFSLHEIGIWGKSTL